MHCKVDGKLFAAITEWQKIDISLDLRAGFPGLTLKSGSTFSAPTLPTKIIIMYQICTSMIGKRVKKTCKNNVFLPPKKKKKKNQCISNKSLNINFSDRKYYKCKLLLFKL